MEYGLIFHGKRTREYYCKNMKYRINIYIYVVSMSYVVCLSYVKLTALAELRGPCACSKSFGGG